MFQSKECLVEWLSGPVMVRGGDCVHRHVDLLKITVHHFQKPFLDDGWGGGGRRGRKLVSMEKST